MYVLVYMCIFVVVYIYICTDMYWYAQAGELHKGRVCYTNGGCKEGHSQQQCSPPSTSVLLCIATGVYCCYCVLLRCVLLLLCIAAAVYCCCCMLLLMCTGADVWGVE